MSYTKAQITTKLQTLLRDTDDAKWTAGEKSEIIDEAIDEGLISSEVINSSLTASTSTQLYALTASGMPNKVTDVFINDGTDDHRVSPDKWEQRTDGLYFRNKAPMNGTMKIVGLLKDINTDTFDTKKADFLLYMACQKAYELLMVKFSSGILMSDITMAEIQSALSYYERKINKARKNIPQKGQKI